MRLAAWFSAVLVIALPAVARACVTRRGQPPEGPIVALVAVPDSAALVAVVAGVVSRSADAGLSWEVAAELPSDEEEEAPGPTSIAAAGDRVAVARGAWLLLSDDGGRGFVTFELPLSEPARAIAFVGGGASILIAHGESLALLEASTAGVRLVGDRDGPGEVDALAAGPTGLFAIADGAILASDDGGRSFRAVPRLGRVLADDPPRAVAVDADGDLWIASWGGVRVAGAGGGEVRRLELGPGVVEPSAIAPGADDALYVVDDGELAVVRLDCPGRRAVPRAPDLALPRRRVRRVVRGLLPRLVFDLRAGPGRLSIAFELTWPLLPPDHRASEAWTAAVQDDAAADRRLLAARVAAWDAWSANRPALEAQAGGAGRALLGRAVRALEARATISLLEAERP
jgi:hypothetical protein